MHPGRTQRAQTHGMNAGRQHPVPAVGTCVQTLLLAHKSGWGSRERSQGGGLSSSHHFLGDLSVCRGPCSLQTVLLGPREANSGPHPWKSPQLS